MAPVGKKKLAETAAERLGETVEAATVVGPGGNLGGQIAKATLAPKPAEMLTLIVGSDTLRLFKGTLRDDLHEERRRPCRSTLWARNSGWLGSAPIRAEPRLHALTGGNLPGQLWGEDSVVVARRVRAHCWE